MNCEPTSAKDPWHACKWGIRSYMDLARIYANDIMCDLYSDLLLSFLFGVRVLSVGFRLILAFPSWEHPFSSILLFCV